MSERTKIVLSSGKDQSLRRFHPWVFSGAIKKIHGPPGRVSLWISTTIRMSSWLRAITSKVPLQCGYSVSIRWRLIRISGMKGFRGAWKLRETLGVTENPQTNVFRWVNAEGDGMPGLIVDYYAGSSGGTDAFHRNV